MFSESELPRYEPSRTYAWNYENAPNTQSRDHAPLTGDWTFCGRRVGSPLGIAAGPLLNGRWCLYYAGLGFDVLTYKTVRSRVRECYALPNLQPVACQSIDAPGLLDAGDQMAGSWAVSFGMPSADPNVWRKDIEWTRQQMPDEKLLSVSVVGTMQDSWTIDDLANDYALCAKWAIESGADCVETNFSCPNVSTCDGQLYLNEKHSKLIATTVRAAIGQTPYIIKIGHVIPDDAIVALVDAIGDCVDALAMTNSIASAVKSGNQLMFDGQMRGICGTAICDESVRQITRFAEVIRSKKLPTQLIGVGGISSASDVRRFLDAGAHACHLATAPMIDPAVGIKIREQMT